jgi:biofilm PGA synthesis N-glycosyltransferase PgaC
MNSNSSELEMREPAMAETAQVRYVIVTPVRNEEGNIEETIRCVASQTVRPQQWIVVDDGSTDKTPEILECYSKRYPCLTVLRLSDRGAREPGSGVIRAFLRGVQKIQSNDWEFIVKLDGDLSFSDDYFSRCFDEFRKDPTLAVGGGKICHEDGKVLQGENAPRFHVRGATKIYRRAYWDAAGGVPPVTGWDTIDEVKANMLGWTTRTFPDVSLLHRRETGSADGAWRNWCKNGRANYITGYHPLFMLLKCLKRLPQQPLFLSGIALFWGYLGGYLRKVPQVQDKALIRYVRGQQIRRLLFQKSIWS